MTLLDPSTRILRTRRLGTLSGYALFHLNLMFSSIEEAQRPDVIARCYEPLLDLAGTDTPIAIEASGLTLEIAAALSPSWIARLRSLIEAGAVEFIGSGYAQAIGPLMPWQVVAKNLELGHETYQRLLGLKPRIALVNEQAYAAGLVELYREAGYGALVMDWDDAASHHPEWNRHFRYHPQVAVGTNGAEIALLWSNTIAFQKLQRLVHGDIEPDTYLEYMLGQRGPVDRSIAVYSNDAECFGFRPGRFATEEMIGEAEWATVAAALASLTAHGIRLVRPSEVLTQTSSANAGQRLSLEAPNNPVPVKKQPKYNLTRWASSGRDDLWANAMCHRAFRALSSSSSRARPAEPPETRDPGAAGTGAQSPGPRLKAGMTGDEHDWRELCRLWSSDFRTHITPSRWAGFSADLETFVTRLEAAAPPPPAPVGMSSASASIERGERLILIETPTLRVAIDTRRGLAIAAMGRPNERPLVGSLPHGEIDDITLSADWYTGNLVFEAPGEPKVTDLERCQPAIDIDPFSGDVLITATIPTPLGEVVKCLRISCSDTSVETDLELDWSAWGKGSLRVAHVTLLSDALDASTLHYTSHNGGRTAERFAMAGQTVDLGAPVSLQISARAGVGMTEGWLQLDDGQNAVRLEADHATAALLGLVEHKVVHGRTFCRIMLSALEMDETRKPIRERRPRKLRYALRLLSVNDC